MHLRGRSTSSLNNALRGTTSNTPDRFNEQSEQFVMDGSGTVVSRDVAVRWQVPRPTVVSSRYETVATAEFVVDTLAGREGPFRVDVRQGPVSRAVFVDGRNCASRCRTDRMARCIVRNSCACLDHTRTTPDR